MPQMAGAPVPEEDLPIDHSSGTEMAKTALEQGLSGLTLGFSKKAETALGVKPEDIKAREEANPATSFLSNIAGRGL